eukprot:755466-Hanusia_phi.AAC.5
MMRYTISTPVTIEMMEPVMVPSVSSALRSCLIFRQLSQDQRKSQQNSEGCLEETLFVRGVAVAGGRKEAREEGGEEGERGGRRRRRERREERVEGEGT